MKYIITIFMDYWIVMGFIGTSSHHDEFASPDAMETSANKSQFNKTIMVCQPKWNYEVFMEYYNMWKLTGSIKEVVP